VAERTQRLLLFEPNRMVTPSVVVTFASAGVPRHHPCRGCGNAMCAKSVERRGFNSWAEKGAPGRAPWRRARGLTRSRPWIIERRS
jgi:hypothetical protein